MTINPSLYRRCKPRPTRPTARLKALKVVVSLKKQQNARKKKSRRALKKNKKECLRHNPRALNWGLRPQTPTKGLRPLDPQRMEPRPDHKSPHDGMAPENPPRGGTNRTRRGTRAARLAPRRAGMRPKS
jgi:hypothetical protein